MRLFFRFSLFMTLSLIISSTYAVERTIVEKMQIKKDCRDEARSMGFRGGEFQDFVDECIKDITEYTMQTKEKKEKSSN